MRNMTSWEFVWRLYQIYQWMIWSLQYLFLSNSVTLFCRYVASKLLPLFILFNAIYFYRRRKILVSSFCPLKRILNKKSFFKVVCKAIRTVVKNQDWVLWWEILKTRYVLVSACRHTDSFCCIIIISLLSLHI